MAGPKGTTDYSSTVRAVRYVHHAIFWNSEEGLVQVLTKYLSVLCVSYPLFSKQIVQFIFDDPKPS